MAVYVDEIFEWPIENTTPGQARRVAKRNNGQWCHMIADSETELLAFAKRIGLRPEWIQKPGTLKVHFDLTPGRRAMAIKKGAIPLDMHEFYEKWTRNETGNETGDSIP